MASKPITACRILLAVALASNAGAAAQVSVVPTDVEMPGTQPGEVTNLQSLNKCDNCHGGYDPTAEPVHLWGGSMMAHAGRDPLFWATLAVAEQDFAGSGDLCLRCHAADGWMSGRSTPTDGSALTAADAEGVACDQCHRAVNPDFSEWFGVQNPPYVANDGGSPPTGWYGSGMLVLSPDANLKLGPYADATANHAFGASSFHRDAAFCGTCHDVSNPVVGDLAPGHGAMGPLPGGFSGVPGGPVADKAAFNNPPFAYGAVERTYSEHVASSLATLEVADYATLPPELQAGAIANAHAAATAATPDGSYADGTPRVFSCQTCHMAPTTGKGCNKASAPVRVDLPRHDMTGGSTWMPDLLAHMDGQGTLRLGGGLTAGQLSALADGRDRALAMLQSAASLEVDENEVVVTNLTGHKLISGFPEGRRMWLRVEWRDGVGDVLRVDGEYGDVPVVLDGQPTVVRTLIDPFGEHTHRFDAAPGISQEWAARLLGWGWPADLTLAFDRLDGTPGTTLGELAAESPGTTLKSFHFVLNDVLVSDTRIPPYGMAYDEALTRSILPVPADQYGDPGPGGVYDHQAHIELDPPSGAVEADVDLLYQSTSWEYVQFLHLANDGGNAFLADVGSDLLDGWMATGMAEPVVVASTTWSGDPGPWIELPGALAGTGSAPELDGEGTLVGGTAGAFVVSDGLPGAGAFLVASPVRLDAPFKQGLLVPAPDVLVGPLALDGSGAVTLPFVWPTGVPAGFDLYAQAWIPDPGGPGGFAATNGLQGTTP